jgi:hypothetical protein
VLSPFLAGAELYIIHVFTHESDPHLDAIAYIIAYLLGR